MQYEDPEYPFSQEMEKILARNDPEELLSLPIALSLYSEDFEEAQSLCIRLAHHPHYNVRANALLGFGHLARRFGRLNRAIVTPLVKKGQDDPEEFVRDQANSAADDIAHFLESDPLA